MARAERRPACPRSTMLAFFGQRRASRAHQRTHRFTHSLREAGVGQTAVERGAQKRAAPAFLAKPSFHPRLKLFPAPMYPCYSCTRSSFPGLPGSGGGGLLLATSLIPTSVFPFAYFFDSLLCSCNLPCANLLNPPSWF